MAMFLQQLVNGVSIGLLYALVALGYTMVYGVLRMVNFAHGELFMLGPMLALSVLRGVGLITGFLNVISVPLEGAKLLVVLALCFVAPALVCALLGVMMERLAYRPLRNVPARMALVSSLGVSLVLQNAAMLIFGRSIKGFPSILPMRYYDVAGAYFTNIQLFTAVVSVLLMAALLYLVNRTYLGRCIRAVAEDGCAAGLMGVDVNRTIASVFVLGPMIGAMSGVLFSMSYEQAYYFMGGLVGLKGWIVAILGGVGNITGAGVAGLLLGIVETVGAGYLPILSNELLGSEYRHVFAFLILVIVLLYKPQGILGEATGR